MNRARLHHARGARRFGLLGACALIGVLAALAPSAPADIVKPVIVLGPTSVANGIAIVSGTVGLPSSNAELTINGQPVAIEPTGHFAATLALNGQSKLSLSVKNLLADETATTEIPLTTNIVGIGGLLGPGVLSAIEHAGVTITKPIGGFRALDGLPLQVGGSVLHRDELASLKVNDTDALGALDSAGAFSLQVPGTTRVLRISATDRQGVTQTTVLPVAQISSPASPLGPTVEASNAVGVRIAGIRYQLKNIRRTKRLQVTVTVKDRRGLLVQGAAVGVRSAKARWIARNPRAKRSNRLGRSSFVLTVRNRAFGKRLALRIVAKTPQASQRKASSVRLPRLARTAAARRR
jgi:hypothetical protein